MYLNSLSTPNQSIYLFNGPKRPLFVVASACVGLLITLLLFRSLQMAHAWSQPPTDANCYASYDDGLNVYSSPNAIGLRDAVTDAPAGSVVKVAGECEGAENGYVLTVDKTLTIQGGFTLTNWLVSDPLANPTKLDALAVEGDRVVWVTADHVMLDGLMIQNGRSDSDISDEGGGVVVENSTLFTLSNSIVQSNIAFGDGGGVAVLAGNAVVTRTWFVNNQALGFGSGGAFFVRGDGGLRINQASFYDNRSEQGGAVAVQGDMYVTDSYFGRNESTGNGGALFTVGILYVTNTVFLSNTAAFGGGVAYPLAGAYVENSQFMSNTAGTQGGAIRVQGGFLVARNSEFIANTVTGIPYLGDGGALQSTNYNVTPSVLENNLFRGNSAQGNGGAVSFEAYVDTAVVTITANLFVDNTAAKSGGAMAFDNGARAYLTNNLSANNLAPNGAEGIDAGSGLNEAQLWPSGGSSLPAQVWGWHNTFASAELGQGLALLAGTNADGEGITLTNTILDGFGVGARTFGQNPSTIWLDGILWHDIVMPTMGANITVANITMGDPRFVDRANGDLHLRVGSAAVDAGVSSGISTDFDGDTRPLQGGYDLGADEAVLFWLYLPIVRAH